MPRSADVRLTVRRLTSTTTTRPAQFAASSASAATAALGQFDDDPEVLVRAARYLLTAAQQRVPADVWYVGALVEFDRHRPAS